MGTKESASLKLNLEVHIKHDKDADVFVAYCPTLNIFSQGLSREEAFKAIAEAIEAYLRAAVKHNLADVFVKLMVPPKQREKTAQKVLKRDHFIHRFLPTEVPLQPVAA